jgi:transposase InsO family protein
MKAETAARAIMDHVILKFWTFRYLISDRSSSWLDQLFEAFLKMRGMQAHHIKSSPYRPQTNSLSELRNKHIIRHLRAYCTDSTNFHEFLPAISAAINGTVITALGTSSIFILSGTERRNDFVLPIAIRHVIANTCQSLAIRFHC